MEQPNDLPGARTKSRRRRRLLGLALSLTASVTTLILLEVCVRIVHALTAPPPQHHQLFCEYDPLLGWRKKADTEGRHITPEYSVVERMNSRGLRGPEYPYDKPQGEYRILVLGDSFAEGYTVEFDELFSEVLERQLNGASKTRFEVINAGTGGYSTDQELLFFQTEGKKYQPGLVVLAFHLNDVLYNGLPYCSRGCKPVFKLVDGELRLTNVPTTTPDAIADSRRRARPRGVIHGTRHWLATHSHLYCSARERIKSTAPLHRLAQKLKLTAPALNRAASDGIVLPMVWRVFEKPYCAQIRRAWDITEALIVKLRDEAIAVDSRLLVCNAPARMRVYEDEWESVKRKYGLSGDAWDRDRAGRELAAICRRHGIDFLDPIGPLRRRADGPRLYFEVDGHWNALGHRLVGEHLAERVLERLSNGAGSGARDEGR